MNIQEIKQHLIKLVVSVLEEQLEAATRGEKEAKEEAMYHKGAMESRYDTFKEEAQYLAGGHALRRTEIERWLKELQVFKNHSHHFSLADKVRMGTIVTLKAGDTGECTSYFIVPAGGGYTFEVENEKFTTLNTASPLSGSMILKNEGDEVDITVEGVEKKMVIVKIR